MVLAPTSEEAKKTANRAFARFKDSLYYLWKKYGIPIPPVFLAETFEGIHATGHYGDPAGAREWPPAIATSAGSTTWRWKRASAT